MQRLSRIDVNQLRFKIIHTMSHFPRGEYEGDLHDLSTGGLMGGKKGLVSSSRLRLITPYIIFAGASGVPTAIYFGATFIKVIVQTFTHAS